MLMHDAGSWRDFWKIGGDLEDFHTKAFLTAGQLVSFVRVALGPLGGTLSQADS